MEVGIKIKGYLESHGISQAFLSTKSGIPPAKLNLALNGKRRMTLPEYQTICWALGLNVDTFMTPQPPSQMNTCQGGVM